MDFQENGLKTNDYQMDDTDIEVLESVNTALFDGADLYFVLNLLTRMRNGTLTITPEERNRLYELAK